MHIESISGKGASYRQALIRFPRLPTSDVWWRAYQSRMAAVAALDAISSAYRLTLRADGNIDRLFSTVFKPAVEQPTRRFFGRMSLLEGHARSSVAFPDNAQEFESWASDLPRLRHRVMPSPLQSGEAWLAWDFRVATHLGALLREAQAFGYVLGYQVHFRSFAPEPDQRKRIGRNVIALRSGRGVPAALLADQHRQAERFAASTLVIEEIVATESPEAARWLASGLARLLKRTPVGMQMDAAPPDLEQRDLGCGLMMHSSFFEQWSDDDLLCSQAEDESFRTTVLGYRPAEEVVARGPREKPDNEPPPLPYPPGLPLPPTSSGPGHIFISYKRSDLRRVVGIMERLAANRQPIWYDRGAVAGDEWDVELERKIFESSMVLFFLSRESVSSKFCRREVRLADANNKPLLIVVLDAVELPYGIKFLALVQQINVNDDQFDTLLDTAIRKRLPAVHD
ncbi:MAG: toll/interleukin-1 receptor domain-containing protein [Xanthobacteraceae bacterium]